MDKLVVFFLLVAILQLCFTVNKVYQWSYYRVSLLCLLTIVTFVVFHIDNYNLNYTFVVVFVITSVGSVIFGLLICSELLISKSFSLGEVLIVSSLFMILNLFSIEILCAQNSFDMFFDNKLALQFLEDAFSSALVLLLWSPIPLYVCTFSPFKRFKRRRTIAKYDTMDFIKFISTMLLSILLIYILLFMIMKCEPLNWLFLFLKDRFILLSFWVILIILSVYFHPTSVVCTF